MIENFSEYEIREQALAFMRENDIYPIKDKDTRLIIDGQLHRYSIQGDKNGDKTGAYVIYSDGWPAGYFQNWRTGFKGNWKFNSKDIKPDDYFKSEEYKKHKKELEALQRQRDEEAKKRKSEASERARILFDETEEATEHPYLKRKGVKAHGLHLQTSENKLIVPLRDINGKLLSIQSIDADGNKRFFFDAPLEGAFFAFDLERLKDNPNTPVMLGEGFATMAKLHETTGYPAVAAMTCGSLMQVVHDLKKKYRCNIIITADNDLKTQAKTGKNTGLNAANEVKDKGLAVEVLEPPFNVDDAGSDWDDYIMRYGSNTPAVENLIARLKYWSLTDKEREEQAKFKVYDSFTPLDCENYTPPEWVIEGYLTANSLNMLYGVQKTGKSYVALDWAFNVATPKIKSWFNRDISHGHVIYFAGEGVEGIKKRLKVWLDVYGIARDEMLLTVVNNFPKLDTPGVVDEFLYNIKKINEKPALIIFDTLNRCMEGDENSTKDATLITDAFTKIQQETSAAILVLHHAGHVNKSGGGSHARGSSVFGGNFDCMLKIEKKGEKIILKHEYSKDEATQKDMIFDFVVRDTGWRRQNGNPVMACTIELNESLTQIKNKAKNQEKPTLKKSEERAMKNYKKAAEEYGEIIQNKETGKEIIAISNDDWRKSSYTNSAHDDDTNKRKEFSERKKTLYTDMEILQKETIGGAIHYCLPITGEGDTAEYAASIKEAIMKRKEHEGDKTAFLFQN